MCFILEKSFKARTTMNNLIQYGWNDALLKQKQESPFKDLHHGRVLVTHKTCYDIVAEDNNYICELSGNMLYGRDSWEYPCTGDWVLFQSIDNAKGLIMDVFPRQKTLYRLKSGAITSKQAIASHVDKAFIVQSLDKSFSVRRIERFLVQLSAENISPVLVLSKADLGFEQAEIEGQLEHLKGKLTWFYTSTLNSESIESLRTIIAEGETVVFIGMSGAGKSTLINSLCHRAIFETSTMSSSTGKGRHTSTRREMVLLEGGGVLIDTPGVKVFGITHDDTDDLAELMNIKHLESQCRFNNCQHRNEKGCAVLKALEEGVLSQEVYESYLKLKKEAWHYTASVHEKRKYEKSFSKMQKQFKKRIT